MWNISFIDEVASNFNFLKRRTQTFSDHKTFHIFLNNQNVLGFENVITEKSILESAKEIIFARLQILEKEAFQNE